MSSIEDKEKERPIDEKIKELDESLRSINSKKPEEDKEVPILKEEVPSKPKSTPWGFYTFLGVSFALIAIFALKIYISVFTEEKSLYANYFYNWRANFADEEMVTKESFVSIKDNTIDPKDSAFLEYQKLVQKNSYDIKVYYPNAPIKTQSIKGLLAFSGVPEPTPRGIRGYYTLTTEVKWLHFEEYLKLRASCIVNLGFKSYTESEAKANKSFKNLERIKTFNINSSVMNQNQFPISDILKDFKPFFPGFKMFISLILNISKRTKGYFLINNNSAIPDELYDAVVKLGKELIFSDFDSKFNREIITNFFIHLGSVKTNAFESNIHSKFFMLFYMFTLNIPLKNIPDGHENRPYHVARMYSQIISNVFEFPIDFTANTKLNWIKRFFGKSIQPSVTVNRLIKKFEKAFKDDEENRNMLLDGLNKLATELV